MTLCLEHVVHQALRRYCYRVSSASPTAIGIQGSDREGKYACGGRVTRQQTRRRVECYSRWYRSRERVGIWP